MRMSFCSSPVVKIAMWEAGIPLGAMRVLLNRLSEDNAVVSIVGAGLLPVYVVWEDVGTYRVGIEPPIALDAGLDRRERLGRAVDSFAERMEQAICAHPKSSMLWSDLWSSSAPFDRTRSDVQ